MSYNNFSKSVISKSNGSSTTPNNSKNTNKFRLVPTYSSNYNLDRYKHTGIKVLNLNEFKEHKNERLIPNRNYQINESTLCSCKYNCIVNFCRLCNVFVCNACSSLHHFNHYMIKIDLQNLNASLKFYISLVKSSTQTFSKIIDQYKHDTISSNMITIETKTTWENDIFSHIENNYSELMRISKPIINKNSSNSEANLIENFKEEIKSFTNEIEFINKKLSDISKNNSINLDQAEMYFYQLSNLEIKLNSNSLLLDNLKSKDNLNKKAQEIMKKLNTQIEEALNKMIILNGFNKPNRVEIANKENSIDFDNSHKTKRSILRPLSEPVLTNVSENNMSAKSNVRKSINEGMQFQGGNFIPFVNTKTDIKGNIIKRNNSILKEIKFNFFVEPKKISLEHRSTLSYLLPNTISINEFRRGIIGRNSIYNTPFGEVISLYADDTASARPHKIIEDYINNMLPLYANTHSDNSFFAVTTNAIYHKSEVFLLEYFNGGNEYTVASAGNGCTGAIYFFIEILARRFPGCITIEYEEVLKREAQSDKSKYPVAFVTEYEHHSNILSWLYKGFEVIPIPHTADNNWELALVDLKEKITSHKDRPLIIISTSAASNITTQITPLKKISKLYLESKINFPELSNKLIWCIDAAAFCSHSSVDLMDLKNDALFVSTHKLTGGPGACGLLFFKTKIYCTDKPPTKPAGGTVDLVTGYKTKDVIFSQDISSRETAGTPGVLQFIRAALTFQLQQLVGLENIKNREHELSLKVFNVIKQLNKKWESQKLKSKIHIIGINDPASRLSTFSCIFFDSKGQPIPFKLVHRILSDFFGVQVRSGCNCAGPFGVKLLNISSERINKAKLEIADGNFNVKAIYGWLRFNCHFSFTDEEVNYLLNSFSFIIENIDVFKNQVYKEINNEFHLLKEYPDFMISDYRSSLHNFFYEFKFDLTKPVKNKFIEESERDDFLVNNFEETKNKIKKLVEYSLAENDEIRETNSDISNEEVENLYN